MKRAALLAVLLALTGCLPGGNASTVVVRSSVLYEHQGTRVTQYDVYGADGSRATEFERTHDD